MKRRFWAIGIVIAALAVGVVGCKSNDTPTSDSPDDGGINSGISDSEFNQGTGGGAAAHSTAIGDLQTVYFDYDKSSIRSDAASALRQNAEMIKQNSWSAITINGNTDERGSEEYNLALGERRADAVKRYLIDLGVPSHKLRTVSFGEAKPAVVGHQESAYQYNRRADFTN